MTARQQRNARRLAERQSAKLEPKVPTSDAQFAANRSNAQFSTGPKTEEGKSKSSLNAVKSGLTGRTVLLPTDDAAQYQQHVQRFQTRFQPEGDQEQQLVQSLADADWRLHRIPSLEMNVYALGRIQFADQFNEEDPQLQPALIEAHTFLAYQKQLNNLSIQESRLRRQFQKDLAELTALQANRPSTRPEPATQPEPTTQPKPTSPAATGFEFSSVADFPTVPLLPPDQSADALSQAALHS